jgi:hypothetical protein
VTISTVVRLRLTTRRARKCVHAHLSAALLLDTIAYDHIATTGNTRNRLETYNAVLLRPFKTMRLCVVIVTLLVVFVACAATHVHAAGVANADATSINDNTDVVVKVDIGDKIKIYNQVDVNVDVADKTKDKLVYVVDIVKRLRCVTSVCAGVKGYIRNKFAGLCASAVCELKECCVLDNTTVVVPPTQERLYCPVQNPFGKPVCPNGFTSLEREDALPVS